MPQTTGRKDTLNAVAHPTSVSVLWSTPRRRALLLRSAVLLGYARCGSSSNISLPSSIPALARTRSNFVVVASSSLMVASRLVWIWPQRFPTALVWLRSGGGFELFGRVEYRARVINSGALLLLGVWFNPMIVAANAVWPRPAIANTCFVLGRCLGWELTPSKAASYARAGRGDSFPRGLHVLPNLRSWWRTLVSLIAGPRSSSREAFWNVLRAAWSSSVELALRVCAWRGGIAGCRLWFHEHPWLWWPTVPMLALILSLSHSWQCPPC